MVMETVVLIEYRLHYQIPLQQRQATERRVVPLSMLDVETGCAALGAIIAVGLGDEPPPVLLHAAEHRLSQALDPTIVEKQIGVNLNGERAPRRIAASGLGEARW